MATVVIKFIRSIREFFYNLSTDAFKHLQSQTIQYMGMVMIAWGWVFLLPPNPTPAEETLQLELCIHKQGSELFLQGARR